VPHDRWLTTHLSPTWRTRDLKRWLLHIVLPGLLPPSTRPDPPPRHRPASPLTFAPSTLDDASVLSGLVLSLDECIAADEHAVRFPPRPNSLLRSSGASARSLDIRSDDPHTRYTLVSFSTGQILEDDRPLKEYNLRSDELLEMYERAALVVLPRKMLADYCAPYFEGRVKSARVIWGAADELGRILDEGGAKTDHRPNMLRQGRRKDTSGDGEHWAIVRNGTLTLTNDRIVSGSN
jgi:hypothetical protein